MRTGAEIDPYRLLFPIGVAYGAIGAALWPLHALGLAPYPAVAHRGLMMLGFEQAFVIGFLLTAMPALTHGDRCRPAELAAAVVSMVALGVGILWDHAATAAAAALAAVLVLAFALARRVARGRARPPAEFLFVGFALVAGVLGAALRISATWGGAAWAPPRFDDRLVSMGMVLPLVLGVGSLLVPTFAGFRDPLIIPGVAGAHDARGRRALYVPLVLLLAVSFAADVASLPRLGYALRAGVAWAMILLVWRPWRPGRAGVTAWALRVAGPLTALGVTLAAAMPAYDIAALHVTFIGGFALLTMAIGTRVIVSHGRRPLEFERTTFDDKVLTALGATLVARIVAELVPSARLPWLAASSVAWLAAWTMWGVRALPAVVGRAAAPAET